LQRLERRAGTPPGASRGAIPVEFERFSLVPALLILAALLAAGAARADMRAYTRDGRAVLLKDDHTWQFVEEKEDPNAEHVLLSVERMVDVPNGCRFGLRLKNNLSSDVKSLVPQFTAFTRSHVRFDTVFKAFLGIKPTLDQYQEIQFNGIKCGNIAFLTVSGGDHCSMAGLTKYSAEKGECLKHIRIKPSDVIPMHKVARSASPEEDAPPASGTEVPGSGKQSAAGHRGSGLSAAGGARARAAAPRIRTSRAAPKSRLP